MVTKCPKLTKNDSEAKFQSEVKKWLKSKGCEVFKMTPGAGIPDATPDLEAHYKGRYCVVECKRSAKASLRPGQSRKIQQESKNTLAMFVYPENYLEFQERFIKWKEEIDNA